jgi:outer membrane lipoprotein-sorting protein
MKAQMPCIIETILMCYKGYCGYSCKVNSFVCAGLPHNHWQKIYIARGETFRVTCDDIDKIDPKK